MSIESEFYHRGFPVRLKYRGGLGKSATYHIFILTDQGPRFETASTIFEAKRKAVSLINEWLDNDWTQDLGGINANAPIDIRTALRKVS